MFRFACQLFAVSAFILATLHGIQPACGQNSPTPDAAPLEVAKKPFQLSDLDGTWQALKGKLAGRELPASQIEAIVLNISAATFDASGPGYKETGKLVTGQPAPSAPQPLDVVIEKGPNAGRTVEAIARLDGEKLVVCYAVDGYRPATFDSSEDNQSLLIEYVRTKSQ